MEGAAQSLGVLAACRGARGLGVLASGVGAQGCRCLLAARTGAQGGFGVLVAPICGHAVCGDTQSLRGCRGVLAVCRGARGSLGVLATCSGASGCSEPT